MINTIQNFLLQVIATCVGVFVALGISKLIDKLEDYLRRKGY